MDDDDIAWLELAELDDDQVVAAVTAELGPGVSVGEWLAALWAALAPEYGVDEPDGEVQRLLDQARRLLVEGWPDGAG